MNCLKILNRLNCLTIRKGQGGGKARVFKVRGKKRGGIRVWVRVKKIKKARKNFPTEMRVIKKELRCLKNKVFKKEKEKNDLKK